MKIKNLLFIASLAIAATPSVILAQTTQKGAETTTTVAAPVAVSLVKESERSMSQGSKNGLSLDLPKTTAKFAEKLWKDYVKQYKGDTKKDKKTDEWFTDNALIAGIGGANTVDMYAKFAESGETTNVGLWIDLGGAYVGSKDFKDKYAETEKILTGFLAVVQKEQTKEMLNDQADALKKLEKQQTKLEKDKVGLLDDIENWKKKIAKAEEDIKTNLKNQDDSKKKIEDQKKLVDEIQKKLNNMK
jgi:hypothetical protein